MRAAADLIASGRMDVAAIDERRGTPIYFNRPDGTAWAVPLSTGSAAVEQHTFLRGSAQRSTKVRQCDANSCTLPGGSYLFGLTVSASSAALAQPMA
jgi:hypothetical protein